LVFKLLIFQGPKIIPCLEALVGKINLSLSQDDLMGSSEIAKCKGIWKIEICFNNALPHGFHCASYHHTNKLEKHCSISSSPRTSNSSLNRPKAGKLPAKGEIATTEEMGKYLENTSLKSCASGLEPSELTSVSKETLHNCACSLRAAL